MPRPKSAVPAYRLHKASGQAVVYINRREHYLGPHGSAESRQRYSELIAGAAESEIPTAAASGSRRQCSIAELLLKYATEELPRYAKAEQHCQQGAIRILRELFGESLVEDFGPLKLRIVRSAMIAKGWSVGFINRQVKRVRLMFKWAVGFELASPATLDALKAVASLKDPKVGERGRQAVPDDDLQAVRGVLSDLHRDLFDLLLLTGCRSGELLGLTVGDIKQTGDIWRADLKSHKTSHKGKSRTLYFNATAQSILQKYLQEKPDTKLFNIRRDYFGRVVKSACIKAGVHVFTPHWLRHTVATRLADDLGTEAAQRLLGHATKAMTEHYSKAAERVAVDAARSLKLE